MKKIHLLICLLFAMVPASAQTTNPVNFGLRGGLNFARMHNTFNANEGFHSRTSILYNAGVFADIRLSDKLSVQPALSLTAKGGKFATVFDEQSAGFEKETITFLQLPVNLLLHIPLDKGNVFAGGGPYIAYNVNERNSLQTPGGPEVIIPGDNPNNNYKRTEAGIQILIGYQFESGFQLSGNFDIGLTNLARYQGVGSLKTTVLGISAGYLF